MFDVKKQFKELYAPPTTPVLVDVPALQFIMVRGTGGPGSPAYSAAIETLYALSYAIKMSNKGPGKPVGYEEYVVAPLEGLWWFEGESVAPPLVPEHRDDLSWVAMIQQPRFVTPEVYAWAEGTVRAKKPGLNLTGATLESFAEGLCVQVMHVGPYADEAPTVTRLEQYAEAQGYAVAMAGLRQHHEIYLADPRRTAPDKLRTVIRHPVARQSA